MSSPLTHRRVPVRLLLLRPEEGGLTQPLESGLTPHWNLGHTVDGRLSVDGGRVVLDSSEPLRPGEERRAILEPLVPEAWAHVVPGMVLPMHLGRQLLGRAVVLAEQTGQARWTDASE